MSTLYVTEYAGLMPSIGGQVGQVPMQPPLATQVVSFTATAGQSAAFNAKTRLVRLHTDGLCSVLFGTNPTAVANTDARMAIGQTEYHGVPNNTGTLLKVSAVTST